MRSGAIYFNQEDSSKLTKLNEEIQRAKALYKAEQDIIKSKYNLTTGQLCFVYYKDYIYGEKFTNVCLGYLDGWEMSNKTACPLFRQVDKEGNPGLCNNEVYLKVTDFDEFNGSVEEARKILKGAKKTIKQEKEKLKAIGKEKVSKLNPKDFIF